jgi:hypothetical protein
MGCAVSWKIDWETYSRWAKRVNIFRLRPRQNVFTRSSTYCKCGVLTCGRVGFWKSDDVQFKVCAMISGDPEPGQCWEILNGSTKYFYRADTGDDEIPGIFQQRLARNIFVGHCAATFI